MKGEAPNMKPDTVTVWLQWWRRNVIGLVENVTDMSIVQSPSEVFWCCLPFPNVSSVADFVSRSGNLNCSKRLATTPDFSRSYTATVALTQRHFSDTVSHKTRREPLPQSHRTLALSTTAALYFKVYISIIFILHPAHDISTIKFKASHFKNKDHQKKKKKFWV